MKKRYHKPMTPCDRLLADARSDAMLRERINRLRADLDPVRLLAEVRSAQQTLAAISDAADEMRFGGSKPEQSVSFDSFVSGLRTAWQNGEVHPTSSRSRKKIAGAVLTRLPP